MVLDKVNEPNDLKKLNLKEKKELSLEIKDKILDVVSKNGGHLASNLGVINLTIALYSTLDMPKDKVIWDVGHQTYTHKILTGRKKEFETIRKINGISGFPKIKESIYDAFDVGHSSTSISLAIGMARARDIKGKREKIIAIIGDGIAAFAGPSGVGKSTLCNSLLGIDIMQTGEVSSKIKRGRHTTRHVELHEFFDGFICDTPGFTSLSLEEQGIDYRDVLYGYPEINALATGCRFDDCSHRKEDGCVIRQALAEGKIDQGRFERYVSFYTELYDNRNNYKIRRKQ